MKFHAYKLAGSAIPPQLVGKEIKCARSEDVNEAATLCKDGDLARVNDLFNQQNILNQERVGKAVAESEEVAALLKEGHVEKALATIQAAVDGYRSGAKAPGVGSAIKAKAAKIDAAREKLAAMSPEDRKKRERMLAELGITFE